MRGKQLRYLEIAQTIKTRIRQGVFPHGQCLPSQKELASIFNTSIMTVRGALSQLADEGIVNIIHGVGTFVGNTGVNANTIGLQGFQNEMDKQKRSIVNTILSCEHGIADTRLDALFSNTGGRYSCLTQTEKCRVDTGHPAALLRRTGPTRRSSVTTRLRTSLYQHFTTRTGLLITQGKEIMSPILLEKREKELLHLEGPATAFFSQRVSISMDDRIVLYDEAYLAGPYVIMASRKLGRTSMYKYIINNEGKADIETSFADPDLWEDLV